MLLSLNPDAQSMMTGLAAWLRAFDLRLTSVNIRMPDRKRKEKPSVAIIGAGRLGTVLAVALEPERLCSAFVSCATHKKRSPGGQAFRRARQIDGQVKPYAANQIALLPQADLF